MDGSIRRLHCRYRVFGGSAATATARLDALAREQVADAWAAALDRALGDDPAVYVLRRVTASLALSPDQDVSDTNLAQRWGERLAGAVVRTIAREEGESDNVVRFADNAEFVSRFISDLLNNQAWQRWFYGAFASLRPLAVPEALRTVLLANEDDLAAILAHLQRTGQLERLLSVLDAGTLRLIWGGTEDSFDTNAGDARPLVQAALQLATGLRLWLRPPPNAGDVLGAIAHRLATPDWRDAVSLTTFVLEVLAWLRGEGWLGLSGHATAGALGPQDRFEIDVDAAVRSYAWLDAATLRRGLVSLLTPPDRRGLPGRTPVSGATPRQRALLADLASAIAELGGPLQAGQAHIAGNALRIYAALIARAPQWSDEAIARAVIESLVRSWQAIITSTSREAMLNDLAAGRIQGLLAALPPGARHETERALRQIIRLGPPAIDVVRALADSTARAPERADAGLETGSAGVFLLLRALQDLRLPALAEAIDCPPAGELTSAHALVAAIGCRVAGEAAIRDGLIDPALLRFAGIETPLTQARLEQAWQAAEGAHLDQFQEALFRSLVRQRLIAGDELHLYRLPAPDGAEVLLGGNGEVPCFATLATDVAPVASAWLDLWRRECDDEATIVTGDAALAGVLRAAAIADVSLLSEASEPERLQVHRDAAEAFTQAMAALKGGALGLPDADLSIAVTTIVLVRSWARWLRGFSQSGVPFLLQEFLRRPGRIWEEPDALIVELEPRPLDVVLEMAGYLADVDPPAGPGSRVLRFRLGGP